VSDYDFKGVVKAISDASPSHLALVSFLVLPVVMNYWLETIIKAFPAISTSAKLVSLSILCIVYLFCLGWLVKENNKKKLLDNRKDKIIGKIMSKGLTKIGFDKLDNVFSSLLTTEEITEVIDAYPKSLRFVRLKQKKGAVYVKDDNNKQLYKPGVGLVSLKDDADDSDI